MPGIAFPAYVQIVVNTPRCAGLEAWAHGVAKWYRVSAAATECPRISSEFLEEEHNSLGAEWFRQEYMCEFVNDGTMLFSPELIDAAMDDDLEPI